MIGIKKAALPRETVDRAELARARDALADILDRLLAAVETTTQSPIPASRRIPVSVTKSLTGSHRGDLGYFMDDLRKLKGVLSAGSNLTDRQVGLLDEILGTVDNETALVFRRLMRK